MLGLKSRFKEKASPKRPLVMAYIGLDDPMRGDSRGAVGVAKSVAEILDGQYVYLDQAVLRDHFQFRGTYGQYFEPYMKHFKSYVNDNGMPDIVIGADGVDLLRLSHAKPKIIENSFNESYSKIRSETGKMGLSCHDLDKDIIESEAAALRQRYPDLNVPLIALYLGNNMSVSTASIDTAFVRLVELVNGYDQATVFVCPSRHTDVIGTEFKDVMDLLRARIGNPRIEVIGQDYEVCKRDYNPYRGLIGAADHHVLMGTSQSMLSEVLMAGKMVGVSDIYGASKVLQKRGLVCALTDMANQVFPDNRFTPPDVTREVAQNIANEYLVKHARRPV